MALLFSKEQQDVFDLYMRGENVFVSGPGGTGKSALIREIKKHAENNGKSIQVCALTGTAAVLLECGAKTIHSFAGLGLMQGTSNEILQKVLRNNKIKQKWRTLQILIIDEVSMMNRKMFQILDQLAKEIKRNRFAPFGGIQILFFGDFYQLPPVSTASSCASSATAACDTVDDFVETSQFCFQSVELWNNTFRTSILLKTIFRQQDPIYQQILNYTRDGTLAQYPELVDILMQQIDKEIEGSPTRLYSTNAKADRLNSTKLASLNTETKEYQVQRINQMKIGNSSSSSSLSSSSSSLSFFISPKDLEREYEYLISNFRGLATLRLKVGARVMCIVNNPCTSFANPALYATHIATQQKTSSSSSFSSFALCNGSQGYVVGFDEQTKNPVVQFDNGVVRIVNAHVWESTNYPCVSISQIPLVLAWAITIHKSQGATMDSAEIDAGSDIFAFGQAYVALSRVKSLDGLFLNSFDIDSVMADPIVTEFYKTITERERDKVKDEPRQQGKEQEKQDNDEENMENQIIAKKPDYYKKGRLLQKKEQKKGAQMNFDNMDFNIYNYSLAELQNIMGLNSKAGYSHQDIDNNSTTLITNIHRNPTISHNTKIKIAQFIDAVKQQLKSVSSSSLSSPLYSSSPYSSLHDLASTYSRVYNIDKGLQKSVTINEGGTNIIQKPATPYAQSMPSEFYSGDLNPLAKRILRQNINIDTRFRDNYYSSLASNFRVQLPMKLEQVVSMQLTAMELPLTFYQISKVFRNNFFAVEIPDQDPFIVNVPCGNYTSVAIAQTINSILSNAGEYYSCITFFADVPENNQGGGSGKMIVGSSDLTKVATFSLHFAVDQLGNPSTAPLPLLCGWMLGFREGEYTNAANYVGEALIDLNNSHNYLFLVVNDFCNENVLDGFYSVFTQSLLQKNILARISLKNSVALTVNSSDNYNITSTPRTYFGPKTIFNLEIQLVDCYGRVIDLNNADYSFCLQFQTIYNL